jgi:NadR type nicotinamide-nucleotide adenylyltransferase
LQRNYAMSLKRISITGPECSGKSSLATALSQHYAQPFVPEFARLYLDATAGKYTADDLPRIAKGQLALETTKESAAYRFLFCDTDMLVIKIWHEVVFGSTHPLLEEMWQDHTYDIYLLCRPDLPWQEDPLREHPTRRDELFERYFDVLQTSGRPFVVIEGLKANERLALAVQAVESLFNNDL